jgi:hypothetical protein
MIRYHDVSQLTTAELERAKRELQANLGLITPHSPRTRADPGSHAGNRHRACRTYREPESRGESTGVTVVDRRWLSRGKYSEVVWKGMPVAGVAVARGHDGDSVTGEGFRRSAVAGPRCGGPRGWRSRAGTG